MRQEKFFVDGIYEKVIENEKDIKEKYYIYTPNGLTAVRITHNNSSIYYVIKDHIDSVNTLVAADGSVAQESYFDACLSAGACTEAEGFPRDSRTFEPLQYSVEGLISYGYTGHDHWDSFGLIYMKGRVYDPALGRFLSPDNYVQNAGDLQSYNRYTYCNNNPLKYTDPDGELAWFVPMIIGGVIGGIQGYMIGKSAGLQGLELAFATLGGAGVGALSGLVANAFAAGGGVMAYTTSIAVGSHFNSIGMMAVGEASGAEVPYSFSVGPASYSLSSQGGEIGYLGKPGNTTMENIGYGLGAFSIATDITALTQNAYNSDQSISLKTDLHTEFEQNGKQLFSYGALEDDGSKIITKPISKNFHKAFKKYGNVITNYDNGENSFFNRIVEINRVNSDKFKAYVNNIKPYNSYYKFASFFPKIQGTMHCTIAGSRALLNAGVFNIPFFRMPMLLDLQMRIRNYTYMSYILTQ